MKHIYFLIILQLILVGKLMSQWVQTTGISGGYSGDIVEINSVLFVSGGNGGVFKSTDRGESWVLAINGLPSNASIQALGKDAENLYASIYQNGIFQSSDMGESWFPLNAGIENLTFYNFQAQDGNICAGEANGGIYFLSDTDTFWKNVSNGISGIQFQDFVFYDSKIYAAGDNLYESSNYGETWESIQIDGMTLKGIESIGIKNNTFYVANSEGVFLSKDELQTWEKTSLNVGASITNIDTTENKVYLTSSVGRIFYTEDDGSNWSVINNPLTNKFANSTLFLGDDIYMSADDGLFRSMDSGKAFFRVNNDNVWTDSNSGLTNHQIVSLATNSDYLFAGTESQGIFVSANSGDSWEVANVGLEALNSDNITNILPLGDRVILSTKGPLYESVNNGRSWVQVFDPGINKGISASGFNQGLLAFGVNGDGIYTSSDSLKSWGLASTQGINTNTDYRYIEVEGDSIFVGTVEGEVFLSPDKGQSWQEITKEENFSTINSLNFQDGVLHVASWKGLFSLSKENIWSKDFGSPDDVPVHDIQFYNDSLFLATSDGFFYKLNGTNKWNKQNDGLGDEILTKVLVYNKFIFTGTFGASVWKMPISDLDIQEITNLIVENDPSNQLAIYPNPAKGQVSIGLNSGHLGEITISILSLDGSALFRKTAHKNKMEMNEIVDLNHFHNGIYLLRVNYSNRSVSHKILIQN